MCWYYHLPPCPYIIPIQFRLMSSKEYAVCGGWLLAARGLTRLGERLDGGHDRPCWQGHPVWPRPPPVMSTPSTCLKHTQPMKLQYTLFYSFGASSKMTWLTVFRRCQARWQLSLALRSENSAISALTVSKCENFDLFLHWNRQILLTRFFR